MNAAGMNDDNHVARRTCLDFHLTQGLLELQEISL